MHYVWNILLKGLVAILPAALTLYLVFWLGDVVEHSLRPIITTVVPEPYYLPGMGLIAGFILLFFIGLVVNAWIVQRMLELGEHILTQIPLVKSVYGTMRDFVSHFSTAHHGRELEQVVMVTINNISMIGFVTAEHADDFPELPHPEETVAVYVPMSFQIGGYTVYVSRTCIEIIDMSVEDAMRRILTAGLSTPGR
jgi:uncharacterized membrane protein